MCFHPAASPATEGLALATEGSSLATEGFASACSGGHAGGAQLGPAGELEQQAGAHGAA